VPVVKTNGLAYSGLLKGNILTQIILFLSNSLNSLPVFSLVTEPSAIGTPNL
jgi:hypothetical protein